MLIVVISSYPSFGAENVLTSCLLSIAQLLEEIGGKKGRCQLRVTEHEGGDAHLVVVSSAQINHDMLIPMGIPSSLTGNALQLGPYIPIEEHHCARIIQFVHLTNETDRSSTI